MYDEVSVITWALGVMEQEERKKNYPEHNNNFTIGLLMGRKYFTAKKKESKGEQRVCLCGAERSIEKIQGK